jgi:hypothetical protein
VQGSKRQPPAQGSPESLLFLFQEPAVPQFTRSRKERCANGPPALSGFAEVQDCRGLLRRQSYNRVPVVRERSCSSVSVVYASSQYGFRP